MTEWIKEQLSFFADPLVLVILAPVVLGILYLFTSFFGERGE